jgi:hypothetical protein
LQVALDKERGRDIRQQNYNVQFLGNPGTGKTVVARTYAKLLQEVGVLPGAAVVETSGAELANGGVSKLQEQLKQLDKGGVLFIDEAYQLEPQSSPLGRQVGGVSRARSGQPWRNPHPLSAWLVDCRRHACRLTSQWPLQWLDLHWTQLPAVPKLLPAPHHNHHTVSSTIQVFPGLAFP